MSACSYPIRNDGNATRGPGRHPQSFLIEILLLEQAVVLTKLERQAADRGRSLSQLLDILKLTVPDFVAAVFAATSR